MADADLVVRAQAGDADALGALYDQHHEALFRYLWARVGETQLAEDLTGDVFMRMLKALPHYRPSSAPFRAWLYRIARNRLVDHYRRASVRNSLPLSSAGEQPAPEADPGVLVERRLSLESMRRALAGLDEAQREVLTLRFIAGLSLDDTAAAMEKSEAAVKALQHRGLSALRHAMVEVGEL